MNVAIKVISKWKTFGRAAGTLGVLLLMAPGWALGAQNSLSGVAISQGKNNSQIVKVQFKDSLTADPVSFTTSNPYRLVLDFADTANNMGRELEKVESGAVKSYQAVQAGSRTRLVLNLTGPASYEVRKDKNILYAVLNSVAQSGSATQAKPLFAPNVKTATRVSIRDVEFQRGKEGEGRVIVTLSDPGVGIDIQQKGKTIQVDFLNTSLPSPLQRRLDVTDFATPAQLIETFPHDNSTRLVVTPKGKWDYYAYQTGNQFILEVSAWDEKMAEKTGRKVYSGEKLSLNFQNVDVRAVLQVIADFTGLNIVAADNVKGQLTMRLKDVPWDQALDIILRARGLGKRVNGNVIWVAPNEQLAAAEKAELEAKKSTKELEPLVTRSYKLNYLRADDAMVVVSGGSRRPSAINEDATCAPSSTGIRAETTTGAAATTVTTTEKSGSTTTKNVNRVLSDRGGASNDLTTNTLIVTDTLDSQAAVEELLKQLDVPTRQVMIESRIVLADDSFSRDLGARLGFQTQGRIGGAATGISSTVENSLDVAASGIDTTHHTNGASPNVNVNLPTAASAPSLGFTILNRGSQGLLSLELQALEADNRGKIISNPRVVTTNLRPAAILQGTQIPYATSSGNGGTNTEFKDALLCLLVSPQILNNDSVILNVEVQQDAQGANTSAGPAINVRRVKTQVRVNNGETAVLGGIFTQTLRDDTSKVPLLGDIPVIGNLFKTNSKSDDKTEMLIFLTPKILDEQLIGQR